MNYPNINHQTFSKHKPLSCCDTQGIAVDDFPALMGLYAGARPPSANKRASSGTVRRGGGASGGGGGGVGDDVTSDVAGLAAARARVNRSLVMRVEKIAATARLWSLVPWSSVRRYDRVHVKGITLRLKQVKGILNFSFVALNKKGRGGAGAGAGVTPLAAGTGGVGVGDGGAGGPTDEGRRSPSLGGGLGGGGLGSVVGAAAAAAAAPGQSSGGSMEDLDGIDTDGEYTTDTDELFDEDDEDSCYELLESDELLAGVAAGGIGDRNNNDVDDAPELVRQRSRSSTTVEVAEEPALRTQSATTLGGALGGGARKTLAPWAAARAGGGGSGGAGGGGVPHVPGQRARSMSLSVGPKRSTSRPLSSMENTNLGNLGVFKVLGEAFMRRFNAYSDQVMMVQARHINTQICTKR